ncbi:MAG: hypothetical protein F6J87_24830 [Spirulina sp. SIO3F2]|nr:hypothetical protein [Spirulina sp. SIO3F2]
MNSIEILEKAREKLIEESRIDSSVNNNEQIAEISTAIKKIEFCNKHKISCKDEVIEIEPLDNFHYVKLVEYTDNDQPCCAYLNSSTPVELTGFELIIKRRKYK